MVIVLSGRALYAARVPESAPRVVYSTSLEEVEDEAEGSLEININTAGVDELDELPQVGPATAESIVEHRRTNGMFRSVDEIHKSLMENLPAPAHIEIELDEPRIARGSVDSRSVRVNVRWRQPESPPPIIAVLRDLPPSVDLVALRRDDGGMELVPRSWQRLRLPGVRL